MYMYKIFTRYLAFVQDHSCILHSIIGFDCVVGEWTRVEGKPNDPNPNKPFAKLDIPPLFNAGGKLNPVTTVIGQTSFSQSFSILTYCT